MTNPRFAFDRSMRRVDKDGHLHVEVTNISKACVSPYFGREIPEWQKLGLDPERVYKLYRHPEELKQGASTFDGKQLLLKHVPVNAQDSQQDLTVGSVYETFFEAPYLKASLSITDAKGIYAVDHDQRELSCAYRYRADMTSGTTETGELYDGVMRGIIGNHVALVKNGRAGPDVLVADSLPSELPTMRFSKLFARLKPFMAADCDSTALDAMMKKAKDEDEMDDDEGIEAKKKAKAKVAQDAAAAAALATNPPAVVVPPVAVVPAGTGITQDALDAAVKKAADDATKRAREEAQALHAARAAVRPIVGDVSVALDSADAVYAFALTHAKVKIDGVPTAAYPAMVDMLNTTREKPAPRVALDSAGSEHTLDNIFVAEQA